MNPKEAKRLRALEDLARDAGHELANASAILASVAEYLSEAAERAEPPEPDDIEEVRRMVNRLVALKERIAAVALAG